MSNFLNNFLFAGLLALGILPGGAAAVDAPKVADLLRAASSRDGHFVEASSTALEASTRLFLGLAKNGPTAQAHADAAALEFEILRASAPASWVVQEKGSARQGRGFFVFRDAPGQGVLQVPHAFKDEMTRDIGLALFAEGQFAAAVWNTVPRNVADMAHREHTHFQSFTRAVAQAWPSASVLQIHGFDQGKRKTQAGAAAELILSAGHGQPPAALRRQWNCLSRRLGRPVALYPESAQELGGTGNAQVGLLLSLGFKGFVHAEISRPLRESLRDDPALRGIFLNCLQAGE